MVATTSVPIGSSLHALECQADFCDAFEVPIGDECNSALYWFLDFCGRTPKWVDFLMSIRNAAVRLIGLKDVGKLADVPPPSAAEQLRVGDRAGIFTIRAVRDEEVLLEIIDSHLDVVLSVYKEGGAVPKVKVITMVFYHNLLGRLYMLPVGPMHKLVVRAMLANGKRAG